MAAIVPFDRARRAACDPPRVDGGRNYAIVMMLPKRFES